MASSTEHGSSGASPQNDPEPNSARQCLICGTEDEPTLEHIVPQTLWRRFGLDPNADILERFRATLCLPHNQATASLHNRPELMDLIVHGAEPTRKSLLDLAGWAVWVTMLLRLARGSGMVSMERARETLRKRFDGEETGIPRGFQVFAARVNDDGPELGTTSVPHMIALRDDPRVVLDAAGQPSGFRLATGPLTAAESIRLGRIALLILGPTHPSCAEHSQLLADIAATAGLERIHPPPSSWPQLKPKNVHMDTVSRLFTIAPFGANLRTLPPLMRLALSASSQHEEDGSQEISGSPSQRNGGRIPS